MSEKEVEKWTQELRDSYSKGVEASKYFTSRILITEFLEDIIKMDCLGSEDGGCLYYMDDDKCDTNCSNYKLYKKWEKRL